MIDLKREKLLSLGDACRALPRIDGKRPHVSTMWRWCRKGVRGVHLEHVRLGHRICTSNEALSRFVNALAEVDSQAHPPSAPAKKPEPKRSEHHRKQAISDAGAELARDGI